MYYVYAILPNDVYKKIFANQLYTTRLKLKFNYDTNEWYGLYAVTDKKEKLKEFLKIRKKEYFVVKEDMEDKDDNEVKQELDKYKGMGLLINEESMIYDMDRTNGRLKSKPKKIRIMATTIERDIMYDCSDIGTIMENALDDNYNIDDIPDPKMFVKDIQKLLEKLYYSTFYATAVSPCEETQVIAIDGARYGLTYPSGLYLRVCINELQIFIDRFAGILSS